LCEQDIGPTETASQVTQYQQANAQGMTVLAAAGDNGASDCDTNYPANHGPAVDEPASLPEVTGVGGTTFNEGSGTYWNSSNNSFGGSATGYIPEVVWNDTSQTNGLPTAIVTFQTLPWQRTRTMMAT
jgi:subtilase family serine protease